MDAMKTLTLVAVLVLSNACQTTGGDSAATADSQKQNVPRVQAVKDDESFRIWFGYYYINQDHDLIPEALAFMDRKGYLTDHPDISAAFLSEVFRKHPAKLESWVGQWHQLRPEAWNVILASLWFSQSEAARILAIANIGRAEQSRRSDFKTMLASPAQGLGLNKLEVADPRQINLLWAAFSATGDPDLVKRVIAYVNLYQSEGRGAGPAIGEAAIMTLANNAMQHRVVSDLCLDAQEHHPDPKTRILITAMLNAIAQIVEEESGSLAH